MLDAPDTPAAIVLPAVVRAPPSWFIDCANRPRVWESASDSPIERPPASCAVPAELPAPGPPPLPPSRDATPPEAANEDRTAAPEEVPGSTNANIRNTTSGHTAPIRISMADTSAMLILIGAVCPLVVFRMLAFVDPGTSSGAAVRSSFAASGGVASLLGGKGGGPGAGSSAGTAQDAGGRSMGESDADSQTRGRFAQSMNQLGGALTTAGNTMAAGVSGASNIGADVLGAAGVGHQAPYLGQSERGSSGPAAGSQNPASAGLGADESSPATGGQGVTDAGSGQFPTPPPPPMQPPPVQPPQTQMPAGVSQGSPGAAGGAGADPGPGAGTAGGAAGAAEAIPVVPL